MLTCLVFSISSIAWSAPASSARTEEPSKIEIPSNLATIQESFTSDSPPKSSAEPKFVIYIQDIHASVKVQREIADLIQYFAGRGLKFVAYEGNEGPVETSKVFWFPDQKLKQAVSEKFLEKLKISGAEYAHVNSREHFDLVGMEDSKLYRQNLKLFQNAMRVRQESANVLQELEKELLKSFDKAGSEKGKRLLRLEREYQAGRIELLPYIKELTTILRQNGVAYTQLPHISLLLDLEKKDKQDHPGQSEKEWRASLENQAEQIKSNEFFAELKELQNMASYASFSSSSEVEIAVALRHLKILKNISQLIATRDELDQYWAKEDEFKESYFLSVIRGVPGEKNWKPGYRDFLDDLIEKSDAFYRAARQRDEIISSNLLKSLRNQNTAVLVAGGFHAPGITRKLKKAGVSYLILSPKFYEAEKKTEKEYLDSIMNFQGSSGKGESLSSQTIRQPTLQNAEEEREDADKTALQLIQGGTVVADPNAILHDMKQIKSKAASLGEDPVRDPSLFQKSLLIPPRTQLEFNQFKNLRYVELIWFDSESQKLKFGRDKKMTQPMRETVLDWLQKQGITLHEKQADFQSLLDHFNRKFPGLMNRMSLSYVGVPDQAITMRQEGESKQIVLDAQLFSHSAIAFSGLTELLLGLNLKTYPNGAENQNLFAVKLYAFLEGLSYLVRTPASHQNWLIQRVEAAQKPKLATLLTGVWNGSIKFSKDLSDNNWKDAILDVLAESWPEGKEWTQAYKSLDAFRLNEQLIIVNTYSTIKTAADILESAKTNGTLDKAFLDQLVSKVPERELLRDLVIYFAKGRKWDTLGEIIRLSKNPASVEDAIHAFYSGLWEDKEETIIQLSTEEAGIAASYLAKEDLFGKRDWVKRFVMTAPSVGYPRLSREDLEAVRRTFNNEIEAASLGNSDEAQTGLAGKIIEYVETAKARGTLDNKFLHSLGDDFVFLVKNGKFDAINAIGRHLGIDKTIVPLHYGFQNAILKKEEPVETLAEELASALFHLRSEPEFSGFIDDHIALAGIFAEMGAYQFPEGFLDRVGELFRNKVKSAAASSLGIHESNQNERYQELLIEASPEDLSPAFIKNLLKVSGAKKGITFLVPSQREIPELKQAFKAAEKSLGTAAGRLPEIRFEANKLMTQRDFDRLVDFLKGLETKLAFKNRAVNSPADIDIAFIADYGVLSRVPFRQMIPLARDKADRGKGLEPKPISDIRSVEKEGVYAALSRLAWNILGENGGTGLRDKFEKDPETGIFLIRLDVLQDLIKNWMFERQFLIAA